MPRVATNRRGWPRATGDGNASPRRTAYRRVSPLTTAHTVARRRAIATHHRAQPLTTPHRRLPVLIAAHHCRSPRVTVYHHSTTAHTPTARRPRANHTPCARLGMSTTVKQGSACGSSLEQRQSMATHNATQGRSRVTHLCPHALPCSPWFSMCLVHMKVFGFAWPRLTMRGVCCVG